MTQPKDPPNGNPPDEEPPRSEETGVIEGDISPTDEGYRIDHVDGSVSTYTIYDEGEQVPSSVDEINSPDLKPPPEEPDEPDQGPPPEPEPEPEPEPQPEPTQ